MPFLRAFGALDAGKQEAVRSRLTTLVKASAIGFQVEQNLWNEHRLPLVAATDILAALLAAANAHDALKDAYVTACRRHKRRGPTMAGSRPLRLGRAVALKAYCDTLVTAKKFSSERSARSAIRRRVNRPPDETVRRMRRLPLGLYVMWATYDREDRAANPFDRLPKSARHPRASGPLPRGEPRSAASVRL